MSHLFFISFCCEERLYCDGTKQMSAERFWLCLLWTNGSYYIILTYNPVNILRKESEFYEKKKKISTYTSDSGASGFVLLRCIASHQHS